MNAKMCSVPLSSNSELSTSLSGGEGGHSKSRALKQRSLLQRGPAPSYTPHAGDTSPAIPLVRIPLSGLSCSPTLSPLTLHASRFTSSSGGEGGIRTHGPIAGTHAFQACRFVHSRTSPHRFLRGGILTCGLMTGKVKEQPHRVTLGPQSPWSSPFLIILAEARREAHKNENGLLGR
jgi:hypothetical protein